MDKNEALKKILAANIRVIMQGDMTLAYKKNDILYTADGTPVASLRQAKESGTIKIAHINDYIYLGEIHDNSIENGCLTDEKGHVFASSEKYSRVEEIVIGNHADGIVEMDGSLYNDMSTVYKKEIIPEFQKAIDDAKAEYTMYGHLEEIETDQNIEVDEDNMTYADIAREKFVVDYVVMYNAYGMSIIVLTDKKLKFNGEEIKETIEKKIGELDIIVGKEDNVYAFMIKDKNFEKEDRISTARYAKARTDGAISMQRTIMKMSPLKEDEAETEDDRAYENEIEGIVYTELGYLDIRYLNGEYIDICIEENT